jgi:H+/Cl- antiporter ClcA
VPSGFFVPQLLIGAVFGRILGESLISSGWPTYFGQVSRA